MRGIGQFLEAFHKAAKGEDYTWSPDPSRLDTLHTRAWARDMRLNDEEKEAKYQAEQVCILGENWWLKPHP